MTRLSAREPIQATSPLLQHGFISRPGRLQGDDRCGPGAAVSSGPRRRGFTAKLQESADHQSRKRKRGLSFGPGLAQDASGVRELVGEGRWLCGFFSFSLDCEGPTVPSSLGLLVQVFDVLLHPGLAWVGTDQSPISGLEAEEQEGEDEKWRVGRQRRVRCTTPASPPTPTSSCLLCHPRPTSLLSPFLETPAPLPSPSPTGS